MTDEEAQAVFEAEIVKCRQRYGHDPEVEGIIAVLRLCLAMCPDPTALIEGMIEA